MSLIERFSLEVIGFPLRNARGQKSQLARGGAALLGLLRVGLAVQAFSMPGYLL